MNGAWSSQFGTSNFNNLRPVTYSSPEDFSNKHFNHLAPKPPKTYKEKIRHKPVVKLSQNQHIFDNKGQRPPNFHTYNKHLKDLYGESYVNLLSDQRLKGKPEVHHDKLVDEYKNIHKLRWIKEKHPSFMINNERLREKPSLALKPPKIYKEQTEHKLFKKVTQNEQRIENKQVMRQWESPISHKHDKLLKSLYGESYGYLLDKEGLKGKPDVDDDKLVNGEKHIEKLYVTSHPPFVSNEKLVKKDDIDNGQKKTDKKVSQPNDRLVYGSKNNVGIRYGSTPYRILYSGFRKNQKTSDEPDLLEFLKHAIDKLKFIKTTRRWRKNKKRSYPKEPLIDFGPRKRAGTSDLLNYEIRNGNLYKYDRPNKNGENRNNNRVVSHKKRNVIENNRALSKIVNAVLKALKNSENKSSPLIKRGPDMLAVAAVQPSDLQAKQLTFRPLNSYLSESQTEDDYDLENNAGEKRDSSEESDKGRYVIDGIRRDGNCSDKSDDKTKSSSDSSSGENNPGNPYTVFKNKYKQNWMWNHFMDGNHMNINPYGPMFDPLGPSGPALFFGRKWWYFNQDDYRPF